MESKTRMLVVVDEEKSVPVMSHMPHIQADFILRLILTKNCKTQNDVYDAL